MTNRVLVSVMTLIVCSCASGPTNYRKLLKSSLDTVMNGATFENQTPLIWLTNQDDNDCNVSCANGVCGAAGGALTQSSGSKLDALAYEVFANLITANGWGRLIEGHRHNYARDFKPETHRTVTATNEHGLVQTTSSCEDLCLLDEAKKRNVDKLLMYQVTHVYDRSIVIHFRLSDARTGVVEFSRTLHVTNERVDDWTK